MLGTLEGIDGMTFGTSLAATALDSEVLSLPVADSRISLILPCADILFANTSLGANSPDQTHGPGSKVMNLFEEILVHATAFCIPRARYCHPVFHAANIELSETLALSQVLSATSGSPLLRLT